MRYMWQWDRVTRQLAWSKGDNPLDLLAAFVSYHDEFVEQMANYIPANFHDAQAYRSRLMSRWPLQGVVARRAVFASAVIANDGNLAEALGDTDVREFADSCHITGRATLEWDVDDFQKYIDARLAGASMGELNNNFGLVDGSRNAVDISVGASTLMDMRGIVQRIDKAVRHEPYSHEVKDFCVEQRFAGTAVHDIIRMCWEQFEVTPTRAIVWTWYSRALKARNEAAALADEAAA